VACALRSRLQRQIADRSYDHTYAYRPGPHHPTTPCRSPPRGRKVVENDLQIKICAHNLCDNPLRAAQKKERNAESNAIAMRDRYYSLPQLQVLVLLLLLVLLILQLRPISAWTPAAFEIHGQLLVLPCSANNDAFKCAITIFEVRKKCLIYIYLYLYRCVRELKYRP